MKLTADPLKIARKFIQENKTYKLWILGVKEGILPQTPQTLKIS